MIKNRRAFIVGLKSSTLLKKEIIFLKAISNVVKSGMDIVGVDTPDKM